jgi:hypothetical protein
MTASAMLLLGAAPGMAAPAAPPALEIDLAPRPAHPHEAQIATIGVTLRFSTLPAPRREPLLRLPLVSSNVDSIATVVGAVEARDAKGRCI